MTIGERILVVGVLIAVPLTLIGVPIFVLFGGLEKFALRPLQRRFAGVTLHDSPEDGDVSIVYHTYRGFFLWFVQTEHQINASPEDALLLLGRLLRFNLTWGMLSYGMLFVPFLAVGNYFVQKRSIVAQQRTILAENEARQ